jgi:enoyl-CoA hydratase
VEQRAHATGRGAAARGILPAMEQLVRLSPVTDGVVTLTLDRPARKNALSIALRDEVSDAVERLARDEAVKVIVVTGAGPVFSAGFDLGEFRELGDPAAAKRLWDSSDRFHHVLLECPIPTLAAVNGPALAGGFDLAVMCDLRIAATSARFAHVEVTFGDVVYGPLRELVGGAWARELALTGREVDAAEALRIGLVSEVVAPEALAEAAAARAAAIARVPRPLLLRTKQKILRRADLRPGATLDL